MESQLDTTENEVITRLRYVIEQIITLAPPQVKESWQFKTVAAMVQEMQKDLKRLPADQVQEFGRMVGQAFLWVADGSMEDLPTDADSSGHSS